MKLLLKLVNTTVEKMFGTAAIFSGSAITMFKLMLKEKKSEILRSDLTQNGFLGARTQGYQFTNQNISSGNKTIMDVYISKNSVNFLNLLFDPSDQDANDSTYWHQHSTTITASEILANINTNTKDPVINFLGDFNIQLPN